MAESTRNPNDHGVHDHGHDHDHGNAGVSHERRDVNVFQISAFGIGLLLGCIVVVFAVYGIFTFLFKREDAKNLGNASAIMLNERAKQPPEPRLQDHPKDYLKDLKADEETILTSYGWIDPNKGIVRIPIDQAIDIVSQKGLPSKPSPTGLDNDGYRMIPEDSSSGRTREKDFAMNNVLSNSGRLLVCVGALLTTSAMSAQDVGPTLNSARNAPVGDLLNMKGVDRPSALTSVTIEQRLNSQVPLDTTFKDEYGETVQLNKYFGHGRPVVLALVYYECPMLCTQILNGVVRAAKVMKFTPGKDYDVVAISFDARETPKQALLKKAVYMKDYGHPETSNGWHFLTGDPDSIKRVTEAVGFKYKWDVYTATFAHASAIYVLTPEGKLSKYFYGIEYSPKEMRLGLVEASEHKIGNAVDQVLLFCYHFDPTSGKYTFVAMEILRAAGAATLLMLGGFVFIMLRRDKQKGNRAA